MTRDKWILSIIDNNSNYRLSEGSSLFFSFDNIEIKFSIPMNKMYYPIDETINMFKRSILSELNYNYLSMIDNLYLKYNRELQINKILNKN